MLYEGCEIDLADRSKWRAVIGSRNADALERKMAYDLGALLAKNGYIVVSGWAKGIDINAHRGAIDAGGKTIALLSTCPTESIYPRDHDLDYQRMMNKNAGGVIYCYDTPAPYTQYFGPRHQRLAERSILNAYCCPEIYVVKRDLGRIEGGTRYATYWGQKWGRVVKQISDKGVIDDPSVKSGEISWVPELDFNNLDRYFVEVEKRLWQY